MTTFKNTLDIERWSENDKEALRWLARAVPSPVFVMPDEEVIDESATGWYYPLRDVIRTVRYDWPGDYGYAGNFLATVTHEAVHTTKMPWRLNRREMRDFEEVIADAATVKIARKLGFGIDRMIERHENSMGQMSAFVPFYLPLITAAVDAAVEWLEWNAERQQSRTIDDYLKELIDRLDGATKRKAA